MKEIQVSKEKRLEQSLYMGKTLQTSLAIQGLPRLSEQPIELCFLLSFSPYS